MAPSETAPLTLRHVTTVLMLIWFTSCIHYVNGFGNTCDETKPCDQTQLLACIGGLCQCESPSNQRYDNSSQKCLSIVGGQCSLSSEPDITRKDCIKNAFCVAVTDENGKNFTECQCLEGFIENFDGKCTPGIGKPCSYQPNDCNPLGMVVCKNSFCRCLDDLQIYDEKMKRCVLPAGTNCKYDGLQLGCVKNAICYPFFYWVPPKCLCKPGYVQTKSRQCVPESEYNVKKDRAGSQLDPVMEPHASSAEAESTTVF